MPKIRESILNKFIIKIFSKTYNLYEQIKMVIYMQNILYYVKPELMIVSVILYIVGNALKKMKTVHDKYIPLILGGFGIMLCTIYVFSTTNIYDYKEILEGIFTGITQGILVAGLSVYVNQIIKQGKKG